MKIDSPEKLVALSQVFAMLDLEYAMQKALSSKIWFRIPYFRNRSFAKQETQNSLLKEVGREL